MTIFYCSLDEFESDSDEKLRDRWNETQSIEDYTIKELERLLEMAYSAESELEHQIGWNHGFISEDRQILESLIEDKKTPYTHPKVYVVVNRQIAKAENAVFVPGAVLGVFTDLNGLDFVKRFAKEQKTDPFIWELDLGESYVNRLPREICY